MSTARPENATPWADLHWRDRLAEVVSLMRSISSVTDPQEMVSMYSDWIRDHHHVESMVAVSRRGLVAPRYRVTRSSKWPREINPWLQQDELPEFEGGLLAELVYSNEPYLDNDFRPDPSDPAHEYLAGYRSIRATPVYDEGESINMTFALDSRPGAFDPDRVPEQTWTTNLFGRATSNLVLRKERDEAYAQLRDTHAKLNEQFRVVGEIQESLLPQAIPQIPGLDLAVHYEPSELAGGDAWDLFPLSDGRWGIFVADVSGHGTPAAVIMAIVNTLSHTCRDPRWTDAGDPGALLEYINDYLTSPRAARSAAMSHGAFVTALLCVFDPTTRRLTYANAGHGPARVKSCVSSQVLSLDRVGGVPLGVLGQCRYDTDETTLEPGDQIVLYTDGITEAFGGDSGRELFGLDRLDRAIGDCMLSADGLVRSVIDAVHRHADGRPAADDQTLIVAKVS